MGASGSFKLPATAKNEKKVAANPKSAGLLVNKKSGEKKNIQPKYQSLRRQKLQEVQQRANASFKDCNEASSSKSCQDSRSS
jgi:hypothetical protein